ncbi:MAG: hypothetical protein ACM34K_00070 [Bacillota bacterium]
MYRLKNHIYKYYHLEIPFAVWVIHLLIIFFFLPGEPLKDERIFYDVAVSFKNIPQALSLAFLKTYESPQTPLSFYLAGLILNIRQSIFLLRLSDSVMVFLTLVIFSKSLRALLPKRPGLSIYLISVFLLNPYLHFIGVLFYTDTLYLLCVSAIIYSFIKNKNGIVYYLTLFAAPLIRQFGIIYAAGNAAASLKKRETFLNKELIFSLLSMSGLIFFMLFWNGTMPKNSFMQSNNRIREVFGQIFAYVPAYHLSALGFYLSPIIIYYLNKIYKSRTFLAGSLLGGIFYIIAPARQNYSTILLQPYNTTLGFYHKLMIWLFHDPYYHIVLFLFSSVAGGWILHLSVSRKIPLVFKLWIGLFLIMSFFNLQAWDKYLLDIQAVILAAFAFFLNVDQPEAEYK